jgi:hypothetical protein
VQQHRRLINILKKAQTMKNNILLIIISIITFNESFAQWTKINNIPTQEIVAVTNMNDTLYASSGTNLIYKSVDSGVIWNELSISNQPIAVYTLKIIDNKIYIGTLNNGIFISADFGATWTNYNNTLPAVSGFEKFNGSIYASTVGNGVYKYDTIANNWLPFNNQLPSNISYNVDAIVSTSDRLLIGAGGNGTFYYYDFIGNQWVLGYYYGNLLPGLMINKIINYSDTLFAINRRRIIRSNNGGLNWTDDKIGTHDGDSRNIFLGTDNFYTITNLITGGTWVQKRNKNASIGTSWNIDEEFFPTGYSYDIIEFNGKLFLAKEDGLYVKDIVLGIDNPIDSKNEVSMFPNPSKGGSIKIYSPTKMNKISVTNLLGQTIYTATISENHFELHQNFQLGIYLISVYFSNKEVMIKKLLIE